MFLAPLEAKEDSKHTESILKFKESLKYLVLHSSEDLVKESVGCGDLYPDVLVHALDDFGELSVDISGVARVS